MGMEAFFTNDLRLLLLITGVLVILIIYMAGRKSLKNKAGIGIQAMQPGQSPLDPAYRNKDKTLPPYDKYDEHYLEEEDYLLNQEGDFESVTNDDYLSDCSEIVEKPQEEPVFVPASEPFEGLRTLPSNVEPLTICVTVMSPYGAFFSAEKVKSSLEATTLIYGEMQIYHYYEYASLDKSGRKYKVFSVANAMEPGSFNRAKLNSYQTKGLSLFLQIPSPIEGVLAFERMCQLARYLAGRLGGVFCDDKHNKMTSQAISHIKDEITAYNLKLLAKKQSVH